MMRTVWLGSVAALVMASVLLADPGLVRTRDGSSFEGELTESNDTVTITIRGIETVIPRSDVVSIEKVGDYDQEFLARFQKLENNDIAGRIALAREAFDRNRYELSRSVLENALAINANSREASELLDVVNSHIRMDRAKADAAATPPAKPQPAATPAPLLTDRRFLTPADIEAIRRKEVKADDSSVRLRFDGDVKKRFADSQNIPFPDFNMVPPLAQALQILDKGDESMKANVRIMTDPEALLIYRRQVQPLVVQGCATTSCHGASAGGGFMLFTAPENDTTTYTNFYILQSYQRPADAPQGIFAQRMQKLITRGNGDQSLIANYGLPPTIGEFDHPLVRGRPIQPIFRNKDDLRYRMLVDWMDTTLIPFEPDYGIRYTPPLPTTVPAGTAQ